MTAIDDLRAHLASGGVLRAYKLGSVPSSPAYPYAVISMAPSPPVIRTLDGSGMPDGRFVVQHFAQTHDGVSDIADKTFARFEGQPLPLPHAPVAQQELASPVYRDPDDNGVLSITHTYRY